MKNKEITASKKANGKIQYLTEILPEIPTNTILYKKLTGLGATYGELKANRNSIIIEPNKPVISGKERHMANDLKARIISTPARSATLFISARFFLSNPSSII